MAKVGGHLGCKILIPCSGNLEVQLTNRKVWSPEILGTEEDLVVGQIATAKDLSNTPEGGVRPKEQTPGEREMEG